MNREVVRHDERGSTLLLYPAAFMVILVLAAIAVDLSMIHLARRELLRSASQAADDGAAMLDADAIRSSSFDTLDLDRAREVVVVEMAAQRLPGDLIGSPRVDAGPRPGTVAVTATMRIEHVFSSVVPGAPRSETITVEVIGEVIGQ